MSNSPTNRRRINMAVIGIFSAGLIVVPALSATAATGTPSSEGSQKQCVVTPSKVVTTTVAAKTHIEQRWLRNIPGQEELAYDATKFMYTIGGKDEVTHDEWKYYNFVPGLDEIAHKEYQFSRENPGQERIAHLEYQFSRTNPGQEEQSHQEYKYSKTTQGSHKEYQLKKTIKVYTVEHKKIQIPSKGQDRDRLLNWLGQIGATDLGGNWWQLPDSVVASAGINPFNVAQSGTVNTRYYGGPDANVSYQITGIETYDQPPAGSFVAIGNQTVYYTGASSFSLKQSDAVWTRDTPEGWNVFNAKTVQDPAVTEYYNGGNWTTDVNPAGWTKIDEQKVVTQNYVAPFTEYRDQGGNPTTDVNNAGWFEETAFDSWTQFGEPNEVETQKYIAPFTEYLSQDGSVATDVNNAGWFEETAFDSWTQFNHKKVVTQTATEDQTFFLARDDEGNLYSTTVGEEAAIFTSDEGVDLTVWTEFGRVPIVDEEATPPKDVYLVVDENGDLSYTENLDEATWLPIGFAAGLEISDPGSIWEEMVNEQGNPLFDPTTDLSLWGQVTNEDGTPLLLKVVVRKATEGYTEYYVHNGVPTLVLGDSNWTTDSPEDWIFVDKRELTDRAASSTSSIVRAVLGACAPSTPVLAATGPNDPTNLAGLAALTLAVGAGAVALNTRKGRRDKVSGTMPR